MSETHNVVYAVDDDYWMPLYVSIHSLVVNNPDTSLDIFVLHADREESFFDDISRLTAEYDDVTVTGIEVDEGAVGDVPTPHWFTRANLYRFLMGRLLPLEDDSVLYLDCDTIVEGSLEALFDTDLDGAVAAAVPEYKLRSFELGFPVDSLWYNAGVMYIDLGAWNTHDVESRALDRLTTREDVTYPVQEVLNPILNGDDLWKPLHPKFNAMTNWARVLATETDEQPVIIHYTGPEKPWHYRTDRRHSERWWHYLEQTPYSGYRPPDRTVTNRLLKARKQAGRRSKQFVWNRLEGYPRLRQSVATVYEFFVG